MVLVCRICMSPDCDGPREHNLIKSHRFFKHRREKKTKQKEPMPDKIEPRKQHEISTGRRGHPLWFLKVNRDAELAAMKKRMIFARGSLNVLLQSSRFQSSVVPTTAITSVPLTVEDTPLGGRAA